MDTQFEVSMEEVTLRDYRPGDLEAMCALDVLCFEPVFQFSRRAMQKFAEAPGAIAILAEAQGELAGFCIAQLDRQVGYVVTLDVAEAWRRQGLAGRLMAQVEARIAKAGGVGMDLHVFRGNVGAARFYEGIGYWPAGIVEGFYGRGLAALRYRKKFLA